jgi:hypothetical protein
VSRAHSFTKFFFFFQVARRKVEYLRPKFSLILGALMKPFIISSFKYFYLVTDYNTENERVERCGTTEHICPVSNLFTFELFVDLAVHLERYHSLGAKQTALGLSSIPDCFCEAPRNTDYLIRTHTSIWGVMQLLPEEAR